ncbi:PorP/SprF family type IX secretion system membrane protein [Aureivirga marina]|uniref:PorP/SprF family type IX secretion system membrane protein n=1 Tax=Aureivirga marina TaxID=1182451 RepID=UPI0018C9EE51|nr:type IX secretion system membrane protein PorP/SprF [Aureivirga marina]
MKKILLIFLFFSFKLVAQQDPQYTQYMYNMNVINPAYAGSQKTLSIGLLGRTQWVGIDGAPTTFTGAIHAPIANALGAGFSVIHDEAGPLKETNFYVDFSYTIRWNQKYNWAFGVKGGITMLNFDFAALNEIPPGLMNADLQKNHGNFGFGSFFYTDKYYIGASVPNVLKSTYFETSNGQYEDASEEVHFFVTGGYVFDLTKNIKFKPATFFKIVENSPISFDVTANFLFSERFGLGVAYRWEDAVSGLVSFVVVPNLTMGYAYDYTISKLYDYSHGSHEVFLQYSVDFSKGDLKSPRFF